MLSLIFGSASSVLSIIVNNRTMKYENFRNRIKVNIFPLTLHHQNFLTKCQKWKTYSAHVVSWIRSFIHALATISCSTYDRDLVIFLIFYYQNWQFVCGIGIVYATLEAVGSILCQTLTVLFTVWLVHFVYKMNNVRRVKNNRVFPWSMLNYLLNLDITTYTA